MRVQATEACAAGASEHAEHAQHAGESFLSRQRAALPTLRRVICSPSKKVITRTRFETRPGMLWGTATVDFIPCSTDMLLESLKCHPRVQIEQKSATQACWFLLDGTAYLHAVACYNNQHSRGLRWHAALTTAEGCCCCQGHLICVLCLACLIG